MSQAKENSGFSNPNRKITVGLDIGTSKICALVACQDDDSQLLKILGIGIAESEGLNRGVVVNIDRTVKAIKNVIEQAEQQSGLKIDEVVVGIAGDHIESSQQRGLVSNPSTTHEISKADVERLLEETKKISISADRKIIHVIPQDFIIDRQDGIIDPIGMSGVRMEANVHVVTGLSTAIQNIYKCVERAGLKVRDLVLEPLASSLAVLSDDEEEVGVALVDIGGGTTDIAIFEECIIRYTSVFAIAGKHVTDDIRKVLGIVHKEAERIKREYGHSFAQTINNDDVIMIPGIGGGKHKEITKQFLSYIIQPRMEEIFEFVLAELKHSGYYNRLGAGVVITGGTTLLRGTEELAEQILGLPVKIGIPSGITYAGLAPEIESPVYATSVGLALWGLKKGNAFSSIVFEKEKEEDKQKIIEEIKITDTEDIDENDIKKPKIGVRITEFLKNL